MAAFADGLCNATIDLTRALQAVERHQEQPVALQLHEQNALDLVVWMAAIFAEGREPLPEEREVLARMVEAHRPAIEGQRQARALDLVERHAERYRVALAGGKNYRGNSPRQVAEQLAVELWSTAHQGFDLLTEKLDQVEALLARYEQDRHKRRTPEGVPSKLGAAGILEALHDLAGKPLGTYSFSVRAAANARKRHGG